MYDITKNKPSLYPFEKTIRELGTIRPKPNIANYRDYESSVNDHF